MRELIEFEEIENDEIFNEAYNLRISGLDYFPFKRALKEKYPTLKKEQLAEYFALANEAISAERNISDEHTNNELITRARIIEEKALAKDSFGPAVSALKLGIDLRITGDKPNEVILVRHQLVADEPETENELNEELADEME